MLGSQPKPAARTALRVEELDPRITPDAQAVNDVYTGRQGVVLNIPRQIGVLSNDFSPNNNAPLLVASLAKNAGIAFTGTVPIAGTQFPPPPAGILNFQIDGSFTLAIPSNLPDGATGLTFQYNVLDQNDKTSLPSTGTVNIRIVLDGDPGDLYAVGSGVGIAAQVRVFDSETGVERFTLFPYESGFTGGVRVATGDVTGDGNDDVVTIPETGSGGAPRVRVFDGKDGVPVADFLAFADDPNFRGGGDVAVGNVNATGNSVIVGAGDTGGPRVQVYQGVDITAAVPIITPVADFFAYESSFRNGVRVAAGNTAGFDANDQLQRDFIVTGAGVGGGPRVNVFDFSRLRTDRTNAPTPRTSFFAFDQTQRGGVNVAVGVFRNDGLGDIVVGSGLGGSNFRVFDGRTTALLRERTVSGTDSVTNEFTPTVGTIQGSNAVTNFGTGAVSNGSLIAVGAGPGIGGSGSAGIRVAVTDRNNDGLSDILVGPGIGAVPRARIFDGNSLVEIENFLAYSNTFNGGIFVGGNSLSE